MSKENDTRNEDWLRTRTWDLYTPWGAPVTTLADLEATVDDVDAFMMLPAAEAMPTPLLNEVAIRQHHGPR